MSPRISVCIPTHNYARYLPQAIESVLAQRFEDFELIILDDCSVDGTRDVVEDYASRDGRIIFRVNPFNVGMVQNWNLCLREARGEYIKYLFGDDFFVSPETLGKMAGFLDSDSGVSLVASARNVVDEHSKVLEVLSNFNDRTTYDGKDVIRQLVATHQNKIGEPSAVMFRRKQAARGFDVKYRQLVDLEMWFHLLEQGRLAYLAEPLAAFRVHAEQQTKANQSDLRHVDDAVFLFTDYVCNAEKAYLDIGMFEKRYMIYDYMYQIWKGHKRGVIDKSVAVRKISSCYGMPKFMALFPIYKTVKPFWRLMRYLSGRRYENWFVA